MQLSVCTIALRTRPPEEAFPLLARLGYKNLDVLAYGKQAHLSRAMDKARRRQILDLARSLGLRIVSMAGSVGDKFNSDSEAERRQEVQNVKDEIDLAVEAGVAVIRVSPGDGEDLDRIMSRSLPHLKAACAYAEQKNVRMATENHSGGLAGNPDNAATLCRAVGSAYYGVIYEPGNLLGVNIDYKRGLEIQKDHIQHVHVKDGYAHFFGQKNDSFAPQRLFCTLFGMGQLDIPWIMDRLQGLGYDRFVSVEYEGCWHPEYKLPPDEEGLAQVKAYMARWLK
jgi:sugar phosphate isomerase/epimerase